MSFTGLKDGDTLRSEGCRKGGSSLLASLVDPFNFLGCRC